MHSTYVLEGLQTQRQSGLLCDISLDIGGKLFKAHKSLLAACSLFFRDMFYEADKAKKPISKIRLSQLHRTSFEALLNYMYTGELDLTPENNSQVLDAAKRLQMKKVVETCKWKYVRPSFELTKSKGSEAESIRDERAKMEVNVEYKDEESFVLEAALPEEAKDGATRKISTSMIVGETPNDEQSPKAKDKSIVFNKEVSAKHAFVGNSVAVVTEYGNSDEGSVAVKEKEENFPENGLDQPNGHLSDAEVPDERDIGELQEGSGSAALTDGKFTISDEETVEEKSVEKEENKDEKGVEPPDEQDTVGFDKGTKSPVIIDEQFQTSDGESVEKEVMEKEEDKDEQGIEELIDGKNNRADEDQGEQADEGGDVRNDTKAILQLDGKFVFNEEVSGKNVMIGNEVAAIGEGAELKFVKPLESDPKALVNNTEMINEGQGIGIGKIEALEDSTIIGCGNVNVQQNVQTVYLPGSGSKDKIVHGEEDDEKKIEYKKADKEELSAFLDRTREQQGESVNEDMVIEKVDGAGESIPGQNMIFRIANYIRIRRNYMTRNVDHFIGLCELLHGIETSQLQSFEKYLDHINGVHLGGVQMNFEKLATFFKCFPSKKFQSLTLSRTLVKATDVRVLATSLKPEVSIETLDLTNCSFEYMALINLSSLLPNIENLILSGLTSSQIIPTNPSSVTKQFCTEDAIVLMESILQCPEKLKLDLSYCDFRDVNLASMMFQSLGNLKSLTLTDVHINNATLQALVAQIPIQMDTLNLSCTILRDSGMRIIGKCIPRIKVLGLNSVMMTDEGVEVVLESLNAAAENGMNLLDLSFNSFKPETVSKLLKSLGKVKMIILGRNDVSYEAHKKCIDDRTSVLSEIAGGRICRLETGSLPNQFPHWIAFEKNLDYNIFHSMWAFTNISQEEVAKRTIVQYRCKKCKAHIAFCKDAIARPCQFLYNDRKLWGVFEKPFFATVSEATCMDDGSATKKHTCANCPLTGYAVKGYKCKTCGQRIGALYTHPANPQRFFCLYQAAENSLEIGGSKHSTKTFAKHLLNR